MATNQLDTSTRDRIIEAAGSVFAQKGFESATVREVCALAQANLAAVNYYFGDKQKLYVEAIRRAHRWRAEKIPLPIWDKDTPAETKLRDFIRTLLTRMLDERGASWHAQLMLREMSRPQPACEDLVSEYIRPHFELLQGILAELMPDDVPAVRRHMIAFGVVGQCLYYRVAGKVVRMLVPPGEYALYDPPRLAEHITNWTLAALGGRPALNQPGGIS